MVSTRLNVGVIGAGMICKVHAENLVTRVPEVSLQAMADVSESAARAVAECFPIPKTVGDYHDILADPAIDATVICSTTNTHARIICEAAQAGNHIFCVKPIDFSLAKIDEALGWMEKSGVKLQVGFNRRFDPNFARVRKAVSSLEIGKAHQLHIVRRDPEPPTPEYVKTSGGVRIDPEIVKAGDLDTV